MKFWPVQVKGGKRGKKIQMITVSTVCAGCYHCDSLAYLRTGEFIKMELPVEAPGADRPVDGGGKHDLVV